MSAKKILVALVLTLALSSPLYAHEFVIKPNNLNPKKGDAVNSEFMAAHIFMISDEMEDPKDVEVELLQNKVKTPVAVKANPDASAKDLVGEVVYPADGTAWLLGRRLPQIWSQTTDGMKAGDKKSLKDDEVLYTEKYEKFAKLLLSASPDDKTFSQPVGHLLEIVPENNPATLKVGDELKVKVLYNGKPIVTPVFASYDGFSKRENVYAYSIEPEDADEIYVKITHPGLWVVRTAYKAPGDKDIKAHVLRSVLEFEVK